MRSKKVYVGMSGGVDSSVSAALLKQQGFRVTGVYMKNWSEDLPGHHCPWKEDYQDAKRVAVQLGIDFKVFDFQKQYRSKVVDYMLREYEAGRTPNPDVMCNQEIKFKLFMDAALEDGADMIATGHYARVNNQSSKLINQKVKNFKSSDQVHNSAELYVAKNYDKDQTYFLYRITETALSKTLFPLGEFETKQQVRDIAKKLRLSTANKKDSQGICFVGKVGIKDFIISQLGQQKHGAIIDSNGTTVGEHEGAIFYTIGQRHGLQVGGGLPYYVTSKSMAKNEVYVTTDLDDQDLWSDQLELDDFHWINSKAKNVQLFVRTRYRAPLVGVVDSSINNQKLKITTDCQIRAVSSGQSAVLYDVTGRVIGGGIVFCANRKL